MISNIRPTFEAVFKDVVVPEIMAEVEKTGISQIAIDWMKKVAIFSLFLVSTYLYAVD
jgi:hypothetical protein